MKLHIKKGDSVKILSGKDRGKIGTVLRVFPKDQKAIVEGMKLVSKHTRPSQQNPDGGIIQQEAPIHISNLQLIDPKTKKPTRVGRIKDEKKGWVRVGKKSGEVIS